MAQMVARISAGKRVRFGSALIISALALALACASEATAQIGGDCIAPALPAKLANFSEPKISLVASGEMKRASDAQLPMSRSVYLRLVPIRRFHAAKPVRFLKGTWKTDLVAGGFVSLKVRKSGTYWIISDQNLAAFELMPGNAIKAIVAERILSIPCRIGIVAQYKLTPGHYRMQFVSSYLDTAVIEFMAAGVIDGNFVDLLPKKRTHR